MNDAFSQPDLIEAMAAAGALTDADLCALARCGKECVTGARPILEARHCERLAKVYRYWKGATPSFVVGAYYWIDHDYYCEEDINYTEDVLVPTLQKYSEEEDDDGAWIKVPLAFEWYEDNEREPLKCTNVTAETCTFEFARRDLGRIVLPTHELKWLCFAEVWAPDGIVAPLDGDDASPSVLRWEWTQDRSNGVDGSYDPDRVAPHAEELKALQAREAAMTSRELTEVIAQWRGPVYHAPLTKRDKPSCRAVRRKMLVPAFRELRKFGVACAHDELMPSPSTTQKALWERYGVDPDDKDEGAYVGYGEYDGQFYNNESYKSLYLIHNLGDYKRCRVRAVLERAGFVVTWDDSDTKTIQLDLRETNAPHDEFDNGYESDESEYDTYSEMERDDESESEDEDEDGDGDGEAE